MEKRAASRLRIVFSAKINSFGRGLHYADYPTARVPGASRWRTP